MKYFPNPIKLYYFHPKCQERTRIRYSLNKHCPICSWVASLNRQKCCLLKNRSQFHCPEISEPEVINTATRAVIFKAASQVISSKIKPWETAPGNSSGIVAPHNNLRSMVPITRVTAALIKTLAPLVTQFEISNESSIEYFFISLSPLYW